jgi:glycerophosphoryl diester phosphodiesterase
VLLVAHRTPATRAACAQVAAAGARVFETDLQVGRQGEVVVSHYLPFGGVLQRDNWRIRWHAGAARDPRLVDVVQLVPDDCLVLLDLKEKAAARRARLIAALIDALPDRARFRVCGGHPEDLDALRAAGFRTWRTARNARELAAVLAGRGLPDDAVSIRHSLLTPVVLDRLHECAPTVVAWTVNGVPRARQLRAIGVDGVTTDSTAVLRELAGRGAD